MFTAIHLNVCFVAPKLDELSTFFNEFNFLFDAIMLTEMCYEGSATLSMINYNHYFINRSGLRGGGMAMHVRKRALQHNPGIYIHKADYEELCIKSNINMYMAFYRPPSGDGVYSWNLLEEILKYSTFHRYNTNRWRP